MTGINRHSLADFVETTLRDLPAAPLEHDIAPGGIPLRRAH